MITPGWMPNYRTRGPRKVMSYVRVRKRAKKPRLATAPSAISASELELLPLATSSAELPAARVRMRRISATAIAASFVAWLGEQARWMRPRALPAVIAFAGLCGIIASTSYLAHPPSDASAAAARAAPHAWIPARVDTRWQHVALAAPGASTHTSATTIDW